MHACVLPAIMNKNTGTQSSSTVRFPSEQLRMDWSFIRPGERGKKKGAVDHWQIERHLTKTRICTETIKKNAPSYKVCSHNRASYTVHLTSYIEKLNINLSTYQLVNINLLLHMPFCQHSIGYMNKAGNVSAFHIINGTIGFLFRISPQEAWIFS